LNPHKGLYSAIFIIFAFGICALDAQEKRPQTVIPVLPLFPSEKHLTYTIKWDPPWYLFFLPSMEAGELDLRMEYPTEFKGKPAYKILIRAHSSGMLAKLAGMKVEDEFIYYTDPSTFCAQGATGKISEGKRKRQLDLEYVIDERKLHFRVMDESVMPPKIIKDITKHDIPACVQDPISALYSYRALKLDIGHTHTFTVGNDDKIKEVRTYVEKQERIVTPAGKFYCWKVRANALQGGLFKEGGQFWIWLSDELKLPIQFEAKVSLGRVLGVLKYYNH
jgi:hypothetical protein